MKQSSKAQQKLPEKSIYKIIQKEMSDVPEKIFFDTDSLDITKAIPKNAKKYIMKIKGSKTFL